MNVLIIPCYIKTDWDKNCLNRLLSSVQNQTKQFDKVYIVDDLSPLSYNLPFDFVEHIKLKENGGPAKARNIAIEKALGLNAKYLFFTDHDVILDKEWHFEMSSFLDKTDFGAVGGMTY